MKLLVTGGCGFIGSWVVRKALNEGHEVINLDALTYAANPDNLKDVANHPNYQFVHGDICNVALVSRLLNTYQSEAIIHLAAESHVDKSIDTAADFIATNIVGTQILLDCALEYWRGLDTERQEDFRFLHVSTDEVYGDLDLEEPAFTEHTPYAPSSPYAASKAASDHLARAWNRTHGLPVIITNCSNNYGPNQFPEKLIPMVILRALAGEEIPVYGTGENVRDWLFVSDHADALLRVLETGKLCETYNIGGETERKNIDLVGEICGVLDEFRPRTGGRYVDQIGFITDRPGHDRRYAMNIQKIKSELGWEPQTTLHGGLRETVRWYLDNQKWWQKILTRNAATSRQGMKSIGTK